MSFNELRTQITSGVPEGDERKDMLERLSVLEQQQSPKSFKEFVSAAANYMTIIGPFIPALTELAHKAV